MWCIMQKSFQAGSETVHPGQLVNTIGWKNVDPLIDGKYMRRATKQEIAEAEEVEDIRPNRPRAKVKVKLKKRKSS
jgi:hypothetical protein